MNKLLLIEDDEYKATQIRDFLQKAGYEIVIRNAFQSGMRAIVEGGYDLILLDMSIPTFDPVGANMGSRHRPFGGKDVLRELKRRGLSIPVIVVTQYSVFGENRENITLEELNDSLKTEFAGIYHDMVYFDASSLNWSSKLKEMLRGLEQ